MNHLHQWKQHYRNLEIQKETLGRFFVELFPEDRERLQQALECSERAHRGQQRDEGDPYVIHPIRAARYLIENVEERDPDVVIATLLHDVVEDTDVTLEQIREQFGGRVAALVDSVTRARSKFENEEEKRKSKPLKYRDILQSSDETIRIKAVDLLDNMRSWEAFEGLVRANPVRLARWLDEARAYYFEIGRRAGHGIEQEMRRIAAFFDTRK